MSANKIYVVAHNGKLEFFNSWIKCSNYIKDNDCKVYKGYESLEEAEKESPKLLLPKKYVVICNNEIYNFTSWKDCKQFVDEHEYCKFKACQSAQDSVDFINANIKKKLTENMEDVLYAYTYCSPYRGIGFTLVRNGSIVASEKYAYRKEDGELLAVKRAIDCALSFSEKRVIVVYSFMGVQMWANESWTPKTPEAASYVAWFKEVTKSILIDFIAHDENKKHTN